VLISFSVNKRLFSAALTGHLTGVPHLSRQKLDKDYLTGKLPAKGNLVNYSAAGELYSEYQKCLQCLKENYQRDLEELFDAQLKLLGYAVSPYKMIYVFADPFYEKGGYILDMPKRKKWAVISVASGKVNWSNLTHEIFHLLLRKCVNWEKLDLDSVKWPVSEPYIKASNKTKYEEYLVRTMSIILRSSSDNLELEKRIQWQVKSGFKLMPKFVKHYLSHSVRQSWLPISRNPNGSLMSR